MWYKISECISVNENTSSGAASMCMSYHKSLTCLHSSDIPSLACALFNAFILRVMHFAHRIIPISSPNSSMITSQ